MSRRLVGEEFQKSVFNCDDRFGTASKAGISRAANPFK